MAAQPYEESPSARSEQPPRSRARQDTRAMSNQETMASDMPRRSRRSGGGRPPGPPAPPKKTKGGWRRFVPSWKILVAGFVVVAAGIFGMIMVAYANTPIPTTAQAEATAQQSTIYYNDGKTVIAKLGTPRKSVKLAQISEHVREAAIAIENQSFYEDSGISIPAMFRSLYMTATGQQLQGASTITQQMARGYYEGLSQEVSIKRKVNEIFVAVKLDDEMTKDEILETYLNTVNFGKAYGVEAASRAYFNVSAAKLTPEQGAYLAARIQQPSWKDDEPALRSRFKDVITNMAKVWPEKYGQLPQTAKFPKTHDDKGANELGGIKGYMVVQVLEELKHRGLTPDEVRSGGYEITSTFDRKLMRAAREAVTSTMQGMNKEFHAGLAAVDPKNGRVVAFYGGTDYVTDPVNEPFDAKKQAASAFKPYVLAAWLQAGYSLKSYVPGNETVPKELPGQQDGGITNSHNVGRAVDVVKATAQSVNTAFVSMAFALPNQLDDVRNLVEAAGFDPEDMKADIDEHHYQFAIGSAPVTPVEQAAGYSIFANGGKYTPYHVVQNVKLDKKVAYPEQKQAKSVIDPGVAADSTVAMAEVLKSGTAAGKGLGSQPAAGKTGTNNDENGAWFVGYTPRYSTAVGFYREECVTKTGKVVPPMHSACPVTPGGKPSKKWGPEKPYTSAREVSLGFEGAGPPTIAWQKFMLAAHQGKQVEPFPEKAEVGVPENIVPSPTPTPTKTEEDPFDTENPFDEELPEDCFINCGDPEIDDGEATVEEEDTDTQEEVPQIGDEGLMGGGGGPDSRSGPAARSSRPEDQ
ncbi:penicillin-binding protein [Nonomuraea sp. K274]|uniref:Penicillin-binding protein n=1 Tax=Nonomuraea cypriaca TaxID=1187855 RepID=A0A931EZD1_9ACTN|nr:transglycosylase domain-containing protein [Nonomuraea cypriaca]MBF8188225.1 penicillin-binding protein [Nonomuraea cypriaca]